MKPYCLKIEPHTQEIDFDALLVYETLMFMIQGVRLLGEGTQTLNMCVRKIEYKALKWVTHFTQLGNLDRQKCDKG